MVTIRGLIIIYAVLVFIGACSYIIMALVFVGRSSWIGESDWGLGQGFALALWMPLLYELVHVTVGTLLPLNFLSAVSVFRVAANRSQLVSTEDWRSGCRRSSSPSGRRTLSPILRSTPPPSWPRGGLRQGMMGRRVWRCGSLLPLRRAIGRRGARAGMRRYIAYSIHMDQTFAISHVFSLE